jgi:HAE1 family hydrophobic/amphiphilic exporter-1
MLPLVIFPGAGSELYRGLGSVVLGGLIVSTIFTLLLIPAVFSLVMDIKKCLGYEKAV